MADAAGGASLLRLSAWLSPAFPVGGFSYSHGVEAAVHDGLVADRAGLQAWLTALVDFGSGWNDAVLFAEAWRRVGAGGDMGELAELAEAMAGSRERHMESALQGEAFIAAAQGWPHPRVRLLTAQMPYAVAVGAICGAHGIPLEAALSVYLQAFAANIVQASIRLGVTGQTGAVETLAALEPLLLIVAARAAASSLDDLGGSTILSDIAAMRHETTPSRLFRS